MKQASKRVITDEIRSDRQVADLILVGLTGNGNVNAQVGFNVPDDDLEEVFQSTWVNQPNITVLTSDTEISDIAAGAITVSAGGAAFKTGMLTLFTGLTTAANNILGSRAQPRSHDLSDAWRDDQS